MSARQLTCSLYLTPEALPGSPVPRLQNSNVTTD